MSTTRTCINRYSLPTSVQWQFSGIPPPPQLLTPNLFHPSSGTGEFSGFGPCSGLGALPQDSKPNMPTTAIRLNVRVNSWNSPSRTDLWLQWSHSGSWTPLSLSTWSGTITLSPLWKRSSRGFTSFASWGTCHRSCWNSSTLPSLNPSSAHP